MRMFLRRVFQADKFQNLRPVSATFQKLGTQGIGQHLCEPFLKNASSHDWRKEVRLQL